MYSLYKLFIRTTALCFVLFSFISCSDRHMIEEGISLSLAKLRSEAYSNVRYDLHFSIPQHLDSAVHAQESISLNLEKRQDIIIDFSEPSLVEGRIQANGNNIDVISESGHIIIPKSYTRKGENNIHIKFTSGGESLNRREKFLYTLLVPARAHTLFPCFDQPDLKAEYCLSLDLPQGWTSVGNSIGSKTTEPLSTYLFAFVAGEFQKVSACRGERQISMYHRETDPEKIAQCPDILNLVFNAIEYMEDYTGMRYPFSKYDFVVVPDFQYGGMEHTGATLYNDRRIFLDPSPTTDELLSRASLIAHETAHMWFGDCVTMRWFDDVWTKEVFANWFAAKMVRPEFPQINHSLGDLKDYYACAYKEDRTIGSNAIQRPLDNLDRAGLIYCGIIYDKAPIAMEKLARRMGEDNFRSAVGDYMKTFAYSNASWDEMIEVFSKHCDFDIEQWSRVWIKEAGMPVYRFNIRGDSLRVSQEDPFGKGNIWPDELVCTALPGMENISVNFSDKAEVSTVLPEGTSVILPNVDGLGYGCFVLDKDMTEAIKNNWKSLDATARMSLLMSLYENALRGLIPQEDFVQWVAERISDESEPLIVQSMISYAAEIADKTCSKAVKAELHKKLMGVVMDRKKPHEQRILCLRSLYTGCEDELSEAIFKIWDTPNSIPGISISERDLTAMAYEMMIRFPQRYEKIYEKQSDRISNPDRKETFAYVARAANPDPAVREELFRSFETASGRRPESRVLSALRLLCHPMMEEQALGYIRPALELLEPIQKTGDIFFPASWCKALLDKQPSDNALPIVEEFLAEHPDMHPLLTNKILQATGVVK